MSENLPIIWDDKVNSPELLAYFQQFGKNTYVSAEELNQIRDGINELSFPNGFIKTSPLTRVDNEISIAPLAFKWILNKIIFENTNSYSTTINAALDGYYRKDIIVANASGSFQKVEGTEYVDIAFRPDLPLNTLLVYEIDIFGASIIGSTSPVVSNYIEKGEFAESTMTGDSYMHFSIPQYSSVRFVGNATIFKGVYLFPGYKAYSGKKLTLKNFQTTDILLKHLHPDALLNTQLYFPNKADYILKPGKIIEFSLSMIANRFEFIGDSEDISGKEDLSNKGIADGYAPLNSAVKIAAEYLSIVNDLITGGATSLLSAEQGKQLKNQINAINTLLTSDNVNLDSLQELVDAIETVQTSLSTILVNDLTTGGVTKGLTAEMGKSLKVLIDDLTTIVSGKQANLTDVNFGAFQSALPTVTTIADTDKMPFLIGSLSRMMTWANFKALFKTINGNSIFGSGNIVTPDMDTTTAQPVSGIKTFLDGKFGLRNTANTFTSFFTNAVTASRTWTWPDKNGTVAMTSDIPAVPISGSTNKLIKFTSSSVGGNSRIEDTGTFLGIGTVTPPLKDITLGNQNNRDIGIEDSSSIVDGKDLSISAGRTVNFLSSSALVPFNQTYRVYTNMFSDYSGNIYAVVYNTGIFKQTGGVGVFSFIAGSDFGGLITGGCATPNGDIYFCRLNGDIFKQSRGVGSFYALGQTSRAWDSMTSTPNGDVYASVGQFNSLAIIGDIYKQTGGVGNFVAMGFPARQYSLSASPSGDVLVAAYGGSIYKISAGTSVLTDLIQTNRDYTSIATNGTDTFACVKYGDIYKQTNNTGNFNATSQLGRDYSGVVYTVGQKLYASVLGEDIYSVNLTSLGTSNLNGGTLKLKSGSGKGTGANKVQIITSQKTVSGTDMQAETVRAEFDENGNYKRIGTPVYADNTAALAGGLKVGMEYRTATGVKMEVY